MFQSRGIGIGIIDPVVFGKGEAGEAEEVTVGG